MKNQFVADVNDYFKFGFLRAVCGETKTPLGVWWLLTNDDAARHGEKLPYLEDDSYRHCDGKLHGALQHISSAANHRNVFSIEKYEVLPHARYWPSQASGHNAKEVAANSHTVLSDPYLRLKNFKAMLKYFSPCSVVFADPDNGLEVKSMSKPERYIRWTELDAVFDAGKSLIIYQHKPQGKSLDEHVPEVQERINELTGTAATAIACGRGPKKAEIAFLVVAQPAAAAQIAAATDTFLARYAAFARPI